jgi:protein-L-isoaspartate O-methyltransferase
MSVVHAAQTEAGRIYRDTRPYPGVYFMRVARLTPRAWVRRLVNKGDPLAGFWGALLKNHPAAVLMACRHRGSCAFTGKRWETKRYVLLVPSKRLREVQARPGYTTNRRTP